VANIPIYQALAEAFAGEGVDTFFTLMGDANMHWATAMLGIDGMRMVHVRHEHAACCMAMGYWSATGRVGVASTTSGPGLTQIMTALTTAVRARVPLVIFTGEAPMNAKWYAQEIDQAPFANACGAHYIRAHAPRRLHEYVREAFYTARHERRPAVIGMPYDLQKEPAPDLGPYVSSDIVVPKLTPPIPAEAEIRAVAERLVKAKCPVIVAGKGVIDAGAADALEEIAERAGALLATTLMARGLYDANPFSLGVSGGYARQVAREIGEKADLVIAIGASMTYYTIDGGRMYPKAEIVQIDSAPIGLRHGAPVAGHYVKGDAKLAADALLAALDGLGPACANVRTEELARRIRDEPADPTAYPAEDGLLDPRAVVDALDEVLEKDCDVISGSGHQSYFHSVMRGWAPGKYHVMRDFGAIGNGLGFAMGIAAARGNGRVLLFEGDGSLIMHIQELETIARHGLKLLICIMNDGAYGSEIHKFREEGMDDSSVIFGRPDFASIAKSFGLRGATVTDLGQFAALAKDYEAGDTAAVWDVHISDKVVSPRMRKTVTLGHGSM
jgi:thiamine pyrophosphate-dependent acetolactate synthase large subunit-like protein